MAQISASKQKLQNAANILQGTYTYNSQFGSQTPTQIKLLEEQEKKFVDDGLIPYLKEVIEEAAQVLCVPVSIQAIFNPDKGVQLVADVRTSPRTAKAQPTPPPPQPKPHRTNGQPSLPKGDNLNLRVNVGNGKIINEFNAADTFVQAIIYAMEKFGADKVAETVLQLNMKLDKEFLVKKGRFSEPKASSRELMQGYYTNTHSSTPTKQSELKRISEALKLNWIITAD